MPLDRAEIECEVDRLIAGRNHVGLREHFLAYLLFGAGLLSDVRCPKCGGEVTVVPFPMNNGATVHCPCGTCSGSMRGL